MTSRLGRPEEVARVALFLSGESSYMTGIDVVADGGMKVGNWSRLERADGFCVALEIIVPKETSFNLFMLQETEAHN